MSALATVRQTTDGVDVMDLEEVAYDEFPVRLDEIARFDLKVPDKAGVHAYRLFPGNEVLVRRAGAKAFPGIVETMEPSRGGGKATTVSVRGVHKGQHFLRRTLCTSYDFDEDGDPSTTRDGVTVAPWAPFTLRDPGGTLDIYGLAPPVDGVPVDSMVKMILGSRFVYQIDFRDNGHFLASDVYAAGNSLQVYRDGATGDLRPALQRVRKDGDGFHDNPSGERVESIPLYNGDRNIGSMGEVSSVTVTLVGVRSGTDDPVVEVCRDAVTSAGANNTSRTYSSVSLTHAASPNGVSGLDSWTGSVSFGGAESVKNALGFRIRIAGSDGSAGTTKLYYLKADCPLASTDTGLTEGTIATYSNPDLDGLAEDPDTSSATATVSGKDWVESDFHGMTRLDAMEALRRSTESDAGTNTSPHWDIWVDDDLALHFAERRGTDKARRYSFADGNMEVVRHQYDGVEVAYQTIAYGPGSGVSQTRIVNRTAFSSGGLYDPDLDPHNGAATSGLRNIARTRAFVDSNEKSVVQLFRKARADHKLHRSPIETYDVDIVSEHVPAFGVGDGVRIKDVPTRSDATLRAVSIRRVFRGDRKEHVQVKFNEPPFAASRLNAATAQQADVITIRGVPTPTVTGLSANGTFFDATNYGFLEFDIEDGASVDKVFARFTPIPWQTKARAVTNQSTTSGSSDTAEYLNIAHLNRDWSAGTSAGDPSFHFIDASVPFTLSGAYDGCVATIILWNCSGSSGSYSYRLRNITKGTTLATWTSDTIGSYRYRLRNNNFSSAQVAQGDLLRVQVDSGTVGTASGQIDWFLSLLIQAKITHTHTVPAQTAAIDWGIHQFDGDSGDGSGQPVMGAGIRFAADATVDAQGMPTQFSTDRHPMGFGKHDARQSVEAELTGYLAVDANGRISSGPHSLHFLSTADPGNDNSKGLSGIMSTIHVVRKNRKVD